MSVPPKPDTKSHRHSFIRTILGDRYGDDFGVVYAHEHLIIDSLHIAAAFPHIHLYDTGTAIAELIDCRASGVGLAVDAMPCASGRKIDRLTEISRGSEVDLVVATGLHHERYYGPGHWTNHVGVDALVELFVADLLEGIDLFDYTGPLVRRTSHRAGIVKVATSGAKPDERDLRNLEAAARASVVTGAPVLTHCEGGWGAIAQVQRLVEWGVPASSIVLSHVDKSMDLNYLYDVAHTGAILEFDQVLRNAEAGADGFAAQAITKLAGDGFASQIVVGTDGARRSLWKSLGGSPGLAWLAAEFPKILLESGVNDTDIARVMRSNAVSALSWRKVD